jgi:hypothetical protein
VLAKLQPRARPARANNELSAPAGRLVGSVMKP